MTAWVSYKIVVISQANSRGGHCHPAIPTDGQPAGVMLVVWRVLEKAGIVLCRGRSLEPVTQKNDHRLLFCVGTYVTESVIIAPVGLITAYICHSVEIGELCLKPFIFRNASYFHWFPDSCWICNNLVSNCIGSGG